MYYTQKNVGIRIAAATAEILRIILWVSEFAVHHDFTHQKKNFLSHLEMKKLLLSYFL